MLFADPLPELRTYRKLVLPYLVAIAFLVSLSACKIEVTVPEGGSVETESGAISCDTDQSCSVDVVDVFFDEIFTAVPDAEYTFLHWRKKQRGFCGGSDKPCRLFTSGFDGNAALLQFLESDEVFYLEPVFAKPDSWERKASMSQRRMGLGACTANGMLYAIGGYDWPAGVSFEGPGLSINEQYDPTTDTWQTMAPMNLGRRWLAVASAYGRCYVLGGQQARDQRGERSVEEYNPQTNTWRARADMPAARLGHAAVALDGKIFVFGGTLSPEDSAAGTVFVYDIEKNSWSSKANMPKARVFSSASVVNGRTYVMGGTERFGAKVSADTQIYDPANNSWSTLPNMPARRTEHGASVVRGKIYIMGGRTEELCPRGPGCSNPPPLSSLDEFDPESGTWASRSDMLGVRTAFGSGVLGGRIYAVGGARSGAYARTGGPIMEEYTPPIGN